MKKPLIVLFLFILFPFFGHSEMFEVEKELSLEVSCDINHNSWVLKNVLLASSKEVPYRMTSQILKVLSENGNYQYDIEAQTNEAGRTDYLAVIKVKRHNDCDTLGLGPRSWITVRFTAVFEKNSCHTQEPRTPYIEDLKVGEATRRLNNYKGEIICLRDAKSGKKAEIIEKFETTIRSKATSDKSDVQVALAEKTAQLNKLTQIIDNYQADYVSLENKYITLLGCYKTEDRIQFEKTNLALTDIANSISKKALNHLSPLVDDLNKVKLDELSYVENRITNADKLVKALDRVDNNFNLNASKYKPLMDSNKIDVPMKGKQLTPMLSRLLVSYKNRIVEVNTTADKLFTRIIERRKLLISEKTQARLDQYGHIAEEIHKTNIFYGKVLDEIKSMREFNVKEDSPLPLLHTQYGMQKSFLRYQILCGPTLNQDHWNYSGCKEALNQIVNINLYFQYSLPLKIRRALRHFENESSQLDVVEKIKQSLKDENLDESIFYYSHLEVGG